MNKVCASAPQLAGLEPYDPKYLPAQAYLSANENPRNVPEQVFRQIAQAVNLLDFNRYPDPLANELRDVIAKACGLTRDWVLVGNGGDELLFNTALAWGGPGRTFLNFPPTFSVYENNARLTETTTVNIARVSTANYEIDQSAALEYLAKNQVAYTIVTSPNNPTGLCAPQEFVAQLLEITDALVMVDEAYFEFSRETVLPLLAKYKNLVILRTFSKAYSLAGVRVGYILAHPEVIREYIKVRQPYSVDAVSQVIARTVFQNRDAFLPGVTEIIEQREQVFKKLRQILDISVYPSQGNWIMFKMPRAHEAWQYLYDRGILIRDFSSAPNLEGALRVSIGTPEQNENFLQALNEFMQS